MTASAHVFKTISYISVCLIIPEVFLQINFTTKHRSYQSKRFSEKTKGRVKKTNVFQHALYIVLLMDGADLITPALWKD